MDMTASIQKKANFIEQQKSSHLQSLIRKSIQSHLLHESDHRLLSPGAMRAIVFEMTHLLLRYRAWHSAPLLAELLIDFLNSEFLLPHNTCTQVVESCLDSLHRYAVPEIDWDADKYDEEFLEHLFMCSLLAADDEALAVDLGFGRNVLELLKSAVQLDLQTSSDGVFQFAPELATRLHKIMQNILREASEKPGVIEMHKLKNYLQRDPYVRKSSLSPDTLGRLGQILQICGAHGARLKEMETILLASPTQQDLNLLMRNGLLFEEPQRDSRGCLYRQTHLAHELTSSLFAQQMLSECGLGELSFKGLPAPYQAALVQLAWEKYPLETQSMLLTKAEQLSPEALKLVIDAMKRKQQDESLVELFEHLLHNRAHAWIRAEICHALPLRTQPENAQKLLESLAENDPSPMVRSAARSALKRKSPREKAQSSRA